jgi:hypothetical protein
MSTDPTARWHRQHKQLVSASIHLLDPSHAQHGNPRYYGEEYAAQGSWGDNRQSPAAEFTLYVAPQVHLKLYDLSAEAADRVLTAWLPTVATPAVPALPQGPESVAAQAFGYWYTMYLTGEIFETNPDKHYVLWSTWRTDQDGQVAVLEIPGLSVPHAHALRRLAGDPTAPAPVVVPRETRPGYSDEPPF